MQASNWFHIAKTDGRREALCQVLALVEWYRDYGSDEDDEDDEGDDYEDEGEDVEMGV